MATKQFSRYPSTKFHKQANAHSKRNLWNCTYTPTSFFLHLSELSTAIQDNYPQKKKTVKKQKKNRLKFSKKQKKKPNTGYKDS
jgi:hypothetical protein